MSSKAPLTKFPLKALVDFEEISKRRIWDMNISELLKDFLLIYSIDKSKDLRLYGTVALSSSKIFKMQVESFFVFEKQLARPIEREELTLPSILDVPYRHEYYSTSVDDLLTALEKIIASSMSTKQRREETLISVPSLELPVDPFIMNINQALVNFKKQLLRFMDENHQISFKKMVKGFTIIEIIRHFILSLFVAQEEYVDLKQMKDDIIITVLV
jgi:hypothetical protein